MDNYLEHLKWLKSLSTAEVEKKANQLVATTPEGVWPDGFPASIDPKLLLIGVSYGNSPEKKVDDKYQNGKKHYKSRPCAIKDQDSHFYYKDTSHYWEKLRYLSLSYFRHFYKTFSEIDAISLTTSINLGTGSDGKATVANVEEEYVKWASKLINYIYNPDIVVLFGLWGIFKENEEVRQWWNHKSGIKIDWENPGYPPHEFNVNGRNYKYRVWSVTNSNGHQIKVVTWPNHPSRHPFRNIEWWKKSVDQFIQDRIWQTPKE